MEDGDRMSFYPSNYASQDSSPAYALVECSECLQFGDHSHKVSGQWVCNDCVESCAVCAEMLVDENTPNLGPTVNIRDGKLEKRHANCAANLHIYSSREWPVTDGFRYFDAEDFTREQIAEMLEAVHG